MKAVKILRIYAGGARGADGRISGGGGVLTSSRTKAGDGSDSAVFTALSILITTVIVSVGSGAETSKSTSF